jgi:hypothetical protein
MPAKTQEVLFIPWIFAQNAISQFGALGGGVAGNARRSRFLAERQLFRLAR